MASSKILHVFAYDISDNKARGRVARRLEDRATRVQGSVFEARMTPRAAELLAEQLRIYLEAGDSLRIYPIVNRSLTRCIVHGRGLQPSATDFWIV
ncbi:CRISPR-associated endonuclease Cas2 [Sedimentitalea todarodis]|uniref:CRISPR-associated endoribonuclease Cas2 n=1 Tax=Sedimentitalea todarodis TaxID=1631240 RepID=A0ABU3VE79_9RHOB|nr:CRISPR-associated endonuclease Cas2 [Sedimentitalea todarodis]MDU9004485.1 CRISPR-associated endonuclease Cas2 [Sedimentitalea todarodis]